jgi:hypothetical protein
MKKVRGETWADSTTSKVSLSSCGSLRARRSRKGTEISGTIIVRLLSFLGCSGVIVVAWY